MKSESKRKTVLVVDDQKDTRFVLNAILNDSGYDTITASTFLEAEDILTRERNPLRKTTGLDAMVVDWTIPEFDVLSPQSCSLSLLELQEKIGEAWLKGQNYKDPRQMTVIAEEIQRKNHYGEVIARMAREMYPDMPIILLSCGIGDENLGTLEDKWKSLGIIIKDKLDYDLRNLPKDLALVGE